MRRPAARSDKRAAYPAYKPSGMDWVGDIPGHWDVRRVKYTASINDEALSETTNPEFEFTYVDIGSVDAVKGIVTTVVYRFEDAPSRARRIVRDGDTIVSTVRTYLRAIAPIRNPEDNLIVSTGFAVVRPRTLNAGYLSYTLRSPFFVETVVSRSTGVSYPAINALEVGNIGVTIPPLEEQRAIAAFLDHETARIDALIEKKQRQIELLQEKRSALMSHAVTKGLDPDAKMKDSGVEWLGEIPAHWDLPPLYARYSVELGKMLDAKRFTGNYLLPYLRNVDVQWDRVNVENLPEMDIEPDEYSRFTLADGDLLVCEGGEVGRTAMWSSELPVCAFQKAIHRVRPRSSQDVPRFYYYIMRATAWSGVFLAYGNPNTIPHLTAEKLRVYRFPFPPHDEQEMIVQHLDFETQRIDALVAKVKTSIDKLQEFRTALVSAAVTGKIDVRKEVS